MKKSDLFLLVEGGNGSIDLLLVVGDPFGHSSVGLDAVEHASSGHTSEVTRLIIGPCLKGGVYFNDLKYLMFANYYL